VGLFCYSHAPASPWTGPGVTTDEIDRVVHEVFLPLPLRLAPNAHAHAHAHAHANANANANANAHANANP